MEKRDLIKDEIERLGKVLGKIVANLLNLKADGETNEGIKATEQALREELELDLGYLAQLDDKQFIDHVTSKRNFNFLLLEQLGDVFLELGEGMLIAADKENALLYLQKSLVIYEYISRESATYSLAREEKVMRARRLLASLGS